MPRKGEKKEKISVSVEVPKEQRPGGARQGKGQKQGAKNRGPPPRPKPKWNMRKQATRAVIMEGYDYLGTVVLSPKTPIGEVVTIISICPTAWAGTRIQQEAALWQRYRPKSLVLEVTTSAHKMMGGQYMAAWTADADDPIPTKGEGALSKLMAYNPSRVTNISNHMRMRIPISTTQKWYYLRGTEDKDVEYGKVYIACVAPLSNVTQESKTTLVVRMRWTFEFSMPDMPSSANPDAEIFASAPNYFSNSSGDWKAGKYLTFKWHEGGDIVEFPGAQAGSIYKIGAGASVGYYISNGTLQQTKYAVCVMETTETGQPMMAPVKDLAAAKAWVADKSDSHLLLWYAAGPWITPENPPWREQPSTVQLLLTRDAVAKTPMIKTATKTTVADDAVASSTANINKLNKTVYGARGGNPRDPLFGLQAEACHAQINLSDTFNNILERGTYDPNDPQVALLKNALEQLGKLSFAPNPVTSMLNVFNWQPLREDKRTDTPLSSSIELVEEPHLIETDGGLKGNT